MQSKMLLDVVVAFVLWRACQLRLLGASTEK